LNSSIPHNASAITGAPIAVTGITPPCL
ncbi:hypothetical protein CCACVL1_04995, partial [Corchorus capsularis]